MPDPRVIRVFTVWQFSDGTYDTNISALGALSQSEHRGQVMAASSDLVRRDLEIFLDQEVPDDAV